MGSILSVIFSIIDSCVACARGRGRRCGTSRSHARVSGRFGGRRTALSASPGKHEAAGRPRSNHRSRYEDETMTYAYRMMASPVGELKLVASDKGLAASIWENDSPDRVRLGAMVEDADHP